MTNRLVEKAQRASKETGSTTQMIVRELLHQDILAAICDSGLRNKVVFQGGNALHLCHGNSRYSDDLDFARAPSADGVIPPLDVTDIIEFKNALSAGVSERHGLLVEYRDAKLDLVVRSSQEKVVVHAWDVKVETGMPSKNSKAMVRIEIADVPAHEFSPSILGSVFDFDRDTPIVINTSAMNEILADKIIALANRDYFKARDVWDIQYLASMGATLSPGLIRRKAADYHIDETPACANLIQKLLGKVAVLRGGDVDLPYIQEMGRFLDSSDAVMHVMRDGAAKETLQSVAMIAEEAIDALQASH